MFKITKYLLQQNSRINYNQYNFYPLIRCCTTDSKTQFTQSDFKPIYKFDHISRFSFINRIKLHATVVTAVAAPLSIALCELNYLQKDVIGINLALALGGTILIHTISLLCYNVVGFLYYNEKTDEVKIAYINYWGKRKDAVVKGGDIIPISSLPPNQSFLDFFISLRRYSTDETWRLSLKYGRILDEKLFSKAV